MLRSVAGCLAAAVACAAGPAAASQRVSIRTDDGVTLAATWHEPSPRPGPAVILVHMLHRTRRDWDPVATRLAAGGIGALAIDLRGHGESQGWAFGDPPDYRVLVRDVAAARRYLATRPDVIEGRVGLAGASLGANLAALAAAEDPSLRSLALLSASLDYRGVRIEAAVRKYGERPLLLVVSDDDPYGGRSARDLQKAGSGIRELLVLGAAGHGTVMLGRDWDLARRLVDWFHRTLL